MKNTFKKVVAALMASVSVASVMSGCNPRDSYAAEVAFGLIPAEAEARNDLDEECDKPELVTIHLPSDVSADEFEDLLEELEKTRHENRMLQEVLEKTRADLEYIREKLYAARVELAIS